MTVTEILADAYSRLNYSTSPAAEVTTRFLRFANDAHRELLSMPGLDQLRDVRISLSCVSGQSRMALVQGVARIQAIRDTTRQIVLRERTMAELRQANPGGVITGIPTTFARVGDVATTRPLAPTGVTTLFVVSTNVADTTQVVKVNVLTGLGGATDTYTATLNGTTAVALTNTVSDYAYEVSKFYVSAACAGVVKLYDGTATLPANLVSTIQVGQLFARFHGIELDPIPSSAITYSVDFTREIGDLVAGNDEPLLPRDFHRLISLGIRKREYEKMSDNRYTAVNQEYEEGKRALRSWVQSDGTNTLSLRSRSAPRPSQLGAYYPAGS